MSFGRGRFGGREASDGSFSEGNEPVPSIDVGEGDALGHFLLIGVEVVLLEEVRQLGRLKSAPGGFC